MLHNEARERLAEGYERTRKQNISGEDLQWLKKEIKAHTDKTVEELKEELILPCSESKSIRIVREKLGFQCKRMMIQASEQERTRCARKTGKNDIIGIETGKHIDNL